MRKIIQPCGFHCIKINNLGVSFGEQTVLEDVNMHIHCGSFNVIIGQNGAGKSTLIKAILGEIPHTGTIEFKDTKDGHMAKLKIGYVPQSVNIEKNTPVSVYDLIASYQYNYPVFLPKSKKIEAKIRETLEVFEAEELIDKQVCNLSGGQLQRVLLSMAIMDEPNLLLLDEPVSGIDNTIVGWRENFNMGYLSETPGQLKAVDYLNHMVKEDWKKIRVGGHSIPRRFMPTSSSNW